MASKTKDTPATEVAVLETDGAESKSDDRDFRTRGKSLDPELRKKIKMMRQRMNVGLRQVVAVENTDLTPNDISSKPPQPLTLKPESLWLDASYQRDISQKSMALILDIIEHFDWRKFKPPVVTKDKEGRYLIIDGQHTAIAAASHPAIDTIPVMFVAMEDVEDQAAAFIGHNMSRVNVHPLDLFFAKRTSGDEATLEIDKALTKHGIVLRRYVPGAIGSYEPNQTVAIGALYKLYERYGPIKFDMLIEMISQIGYSPIRADHFKAFAIIMFERERGEVELPSEPLIELVRQLNDIDALNYAKRISATTKQSVSRSLATHYRNKFREYYSGYTNR